MLKETSLVLETFPETGIQYFKISKTGTITFYSSLVNNTVVEENNINILGGGWGEMTHDLSYVYEERMCVTPLSVIVFRLPSYRNILL